MKNTTKTHLKPIGGDDSNAVAKALKVIAIIEWISSVILFFVYIKNIVVALVIIASGIISGIFIIGFAEIIRLLQLKQTQEYVIITEDCVKNECVKETYAKEPIEKELEHKTQEIVNDEKKEKTDHVKIIFKIAEMSNMTDVQRYMIGYVGYKDEIFRKMLSTAYDMAKTSEENTDKTSISTVREFLAIYRTEVANM